MATHSYPEGKDPREVFADHLAQNTHGKARDPREVDQGEGAERPQDGLPAADHPADRFVTQNDHAVRNFDAIREEQHRLDVLRLRQQLEQLEGARQDITDFVDPGPLLPPPRTGVQYVVGAPPFTPILRPLRQTLYSRMSAHPGTTRMMGFVNACGMRGEDGIHLTGGDTNMTQCGQLGTPLEYDLVCLGIHPFGAGEEYKRWWDTFLNYQPEFTWIFGQNMPWLRTTVNLMDVKFPFMTASQLEEARGRLPEFPEILRQIALDMVLPRTATMTTPDRRARRISSTESFRAEINFTRRAWSEPHDFSVYAAMHGILYASL